MKTYYYTVHSEAFNLEVTPAGKSPRKLSTGEALVLCCIAQFTHNGAGYFYGGQEDLAVATGMTARGARVALQLLEEANLIRSERVTEARQGATPINRVRYISLVKFETKATREEAPKDAPQVPSEEAPKEPTPAPVKASRKAQKAFVPPTVEEVAEYAAQQGAADFDASYFVSYYAAAEWRFRDGKPMKAWKQTVLTWLQRDRKAAQQAAAQVATQQAPQYKEAHITF